MAKRGQAQLTVFCKQCHVRHVGGPNNVLDLGRFYGRQVALLLDVVEGDGVAFAQKQPTVASEEDLVATCHLHFLRNLVLCVLYDDLHKHTTQ